MSEKAGIEFKIGANSTGIKAGLESAKEQVKDWKGEVKKMVAGAITLDALFEGAKSSLEYGARIKDLSERFGELPETMQRVDYAAQQNGSSFEEIATAVGKVTKAAAQAADGNKDLAADFQRLGIDAASFVNLPLDEKLARLSAGFTNIEGSGERVKVALDVLGRSGADLLPLLLKGPEALRDTMDQAAVMTNEEVERLHALDQRMNQIGMSIRAGFGSVLVWLADRVRDLGELAGATMIFVEKVFTSFGQHINQIYRKSARDEFASDVKQAYADAQTAFQSARADDREQAKEAEKEVTERHETIPDYQPSDTSAKSKMDEEYKSLQKQEQSANEEAAMASLTKIDDKRKALLKEAGVRDAAHLQATIDIYSKIFESGQGKQIVRQDELERLQKLVEIKSKLTALDKEQAEQNKAKADALGRQIAEQGDRLTDLQRGTLTPGQQLAQARKELGDILGGKQPADSKAALDQSKRAMDLIAKIQQLTQAEAKSHALQVDDVRKIGGSLAHVNYGAFQNDESRTQTTLQKEIAHWVQEIAHRNQKIEIPVAK